METTTPVIATAPGINEIKLTMDNSLLEMEKRMSKTISETLTDQNGIYMKQIVELTAKVATHEAILDSHTNSIKGFKGLVATVSSVTGVLGGLIGFFISQLVNIGGK